MRILITGGAGFIGSHVTDAYLAAGHEVAVVDDLSSGSADNVDPRARWYRMDIRDPALDSAFAEERPEIVCHHAAQVSVRRSVEAPQADADVNVLGSLNLFEAARRHGVRPAWARNHAHVRARPFSTSTAARQPSSRAAREGSSTLRRTSPERAGSW